MKANYILIASGSSFTPRLDIMILEEQDERAKDIALRQVEKLALAGYYLFDLFDVKGEHRRVCNFNVEIPKPVVTVK